MNQMNLELLDTTLRDGEQGYNVNFSPEAAVKVVNLLDGLVDIIEAGYAGANPMMDRRFELIRNLQLEYPLTSRIAAFGTTRAPKTSVHDYRKNPAIKNLEDAGTGTVVIVGKTWDYHVVNALRTTLEENLAMIRDTISHFVEQGKEVIFDAEVCTSGFFGGPGIKANPEYMRNCLQAAEESGASRIVVCDTNGILMTGMVDEITNYIREGLWSKTQLGFHGHNDMGLATAVSLEMWKNGVRHLHATVNGMGERTGNTSLEQLLANFTSPYFSSPIYKGDTTRLYALSQEVALLGTGHLPDPSLPVVGTNSNTDKAGVHASATQRAVFAYRGRDLKKEFGTPSRIVISGLGGGSNIAMALGINDSKSPYVRLVSNKVNELAAEGYDFSIAEASFYVLAKRLEEGYSSPVVILEREVTEERDGGIINIATIDAQVNGNFTKISAQGTGPVNASYKALVDAFASEYPDVRKISFRQYNALSTSSEGDTSQRVKVFMTFSLDRNSNRDIYTTMGVSTDIIEASMMAAMDGLEYGLMRLKANKP